MATDAGPKAAEAVGSWDPCRGVHEACRDLGRDLTARPLTLHAEAESPDTFAQLAGGARARASAAVTVRLSIEATNSCYGVLVTPARTALPAGEHAVEPHGLRPRAERGCS